MFMGCALEKKEKFGEPPPGRVVFNGGWARGGHTMTPRYVKTLDPPRKMEKSDLHGVPPQGLPQSKWIWVMAKTTMMEVPRKPDRPAKSDGESWKLHVKCAGEAPSVVGRSHVTPR